MSLYVPLVLRLELKRGAPAVDFVDCSNSDIAFSPLGGEKTRRRLMSGMKKRSPPAASARDAPLAPDGSKTDKNSSSISYSECAGRRTYSEVVTETYEADRLTQCSETSMSKMSSEPPNSVVAEIDKLQYFFGNPCVEKTEGILHFYKYNDEKLAREAQCRMLCMVAVPAHQTVRDLINFIGATLNTIERIRIVRDSCANQYNAILKFKTHNDTVVFFEEYNGVQYSDIEPERCGLLFVDRIECVGQGDNQEVASLIEVPTCSVCLERMDDGVLTILCNHTFHAVCLQQWTDTTCPVCRYIQTPEMVAEQRCSDCGQSTDLWICLICGNIGCGRYASAHAWRHFELTSHTFCLQIGGEKVWDYVGDNFVHRLIQTDQDGKMVEYQRGPGREEDKDDKLEGIRMEYTCLLSSQLESQRKFFEARVADVEKAMCNMEKMTHAQMEDIDRQLTQSNSEIKKLKTSLEESNAAKQATEKKHQQTLAKLSKVTAELSEEREINALLRNDQQKWKTQVDKLEQDLKKAEIEHSAKIEDMESQLSDVMMHFQGQEMIKEQLGTGQVNQEEIDNCQLGVSSPSKENSKSRRRSHRK